MKKTLFIMTMMILACNATMMAQQVRIGYFSYQEVLNNLPEYVKAMQALETTKTQLSDELKSSEQEFSDKYEVFVEQQAMLSQPIRDKRQADLISLYDRNVKFRNDSEQLLKEQEQQALAPIKEKVSAAVAAVGQQGEYLLVVNTDSEACPYINEASSVNVTEEITKLAKAAK